MSLVTQAEVLQYLRSTAQSGTPIYTQIDILRKAMEKAVKTYVKWGLEANNGMGQGNFVEYYDGKNYADIALRRMFVAYVTSVYLDPLAAYGQNTSNYTPWSSNTLLTNGLDYSLVWEQPGSCKSGLLRRLRQNLFLWPSDTIYLAASNKQGLSYVAPPFWPAGDGVVKVTYDWGFQPLTAMSAVPTWSGGSATYTFASGLVCWPGEQVQITGCAPDGYNGDFQVASVASNLLSFTVLIPTNPGSGTTAGSADFIPQEIKCAVAETVGYKRNKVRRGGVPASEGLGDYSYGLTIAQHPEFVDVRQLLSAYRDVSVAIGLF